MPKNWGCIWYTYLIISQAFIDLSEKPLGKVQRQTWMFLKKFCTTHHTWQWCDIVSLIQIWIHLNFIVPAVKQISDTLWAVEQPKSIEMGMLKVSLT